MVKFTAKYEKVITKILEKIENFYNDWNKWNNWCEEHQEQIPEEERGNNFQFLKSYSVIDFLINMWEFLELKPYGYNNSGNADGYFNDGLTYKVPVYHLEEIKKSLEVARDNSLRVYNLYNENEDESLEKLIKNCEKTYSNNGTLTYLTRNKNGEKVNIEVIDEEDKNLNYNKDGKHKNTRKVRLYIQDNNGKFREVEEVEAKNDKKAFYNLSDEDVDKRNNYFYYSVEGEETNENNKLIKSNDKFIFLIDKIIKSINGENVYKNAIKKYFYEELLDRYRTLNIEEDFKTNISSKKNDIGNVELLLPTIYNRLDGKAGCLSNQRIVESSRVWKQQKETESMFVFFDEFSFINEKDDLNNDIDYIEIKIKLEDLGKEQRKYLNKENPFFREGNDKKWIEDYLEKNIFNYCKVVILGRKNQVIFSADETNEKKDEVMEKLLNVSSKMQKIELLASRFRVDNEMFIVDFRVTDENLIDDLNSLSNLNQTSKPNYLSNLDGYIKFNYIGLELRDNIVSNSNSSNIVTRNGFYSAKEFISALDDRSFSLTSVNKDENSSKNNIRIYKRVNNNRLEFVMDVSEFSLLNSVETMNYVKILSKKGIYILPIDRVETQYSYNGTGVVTVSNSLPYITDQTLINNKNFSKSFDNNFLINLANNSLIVNNNRDLEGDKSLLSPNVEDDNKLLIEKNSISNLKNKIVYKYLILKKVDETYGNDCSEYFDYLMDKEDMVSIIGFSQSQNCGYDNLMI